MANNEILPIVVFALFFGIATAAIGKKGDALISLLDSISHVMFKVTNYVMSFAPIGIFGAITAVVIQQGLDVLSGYVYLIACFFGGLLFFVFVAKTYPDAFPNRVDTWMARIDNFATDKPDEDDYQIEKAKIAIASGGLYGLGPGKSVQKNFLPQSSSDFIYAIIVEEYGMVGGISVLGLYLLLLFRFVVAAHKANSLFGKLVVVGLGFPIIFQAMTNMAVAVELLPVTGQTLPLISSGGTSIWMTCIALGIILSVTKKEEEIAEELAEKQKRDDALQKLIDKQIQEDEAADSSESEQAKQLEDFSIVDSANPMKAVLKK
jgi:cell division protein FtsW